MRALGFEGRASSVSFRQLRLFETVGRVNSVRKAADECNLSQPAVTQALTQLEQKIGTRLLERRPSGSYLNDCGELLFARAARFFAQMEEAIVELEVPGGAAVAPIIANRFSRSHIRCLIAIVDRGSFRQASELLGITDSSLQRIVRTIEKNLGKPVFCSTAAGKSATREGASFGRRMKLALQEISAGVEDIDTILGNPSSTIVIGAMPYGGCVLLASVLEDFLAVHPDAEVKIVNETASELLGSLSAGNVDCVVGLEPQVTAGEFHIEALASTPIVVVARRGHPLLSKNKVTIDDLLEYHWVIGTPGSIRRACFDELFSETRGPHASIATCALPIVHHLLQSSDRLTLMTSFELQQHPDSLALLPFDDIEPVPSICITTRADWLPRKLHNDFLQLLRKRVSAMTSPREREALVQIAAVM